MKIISIFKFTCFFVILTFLFNNLSAADYQKFTNVRLIESRDNDGDSFHVKVDGKEFHVRLYFVDCPETSAGTKGDAMRVREQTRYFGLLSVDQAVHFGNEAKKFVVSVLARPFILNTVFASAMGRSTKGRIYGFITTSAGDDLGSLLVKNGLARTYGTARQTPDGTSSKEMIERLRDLENSAMLKRTGIWAKSNPEKLAELRGQQRREDLDLQEIQEQTKKRESRQTMMDLNKAGKDELMSINGIGPVLAKRIIAGRPYKNVNDLLEVKGIGRNKFDKISRFFYINR